MLMKLPFIFLAVRCFIFDLFILNLSNTAFQWTPVTITVSISLFVTGFLFLVVALMFDL